MNSTPDFSEFDEIGMKPDAEQTAQTPANTSADQTTQQQNPTPAESVSSTDTKKITPKKPPNPKKMALGCLVFFFLLFAILIVAMVFGLRAGEETIQSFGLNPISFKNWTIGMVSVFFGSLALSAVIAIVYYIGERILADKDDLVKKTKAGRKSTVSSFVFILIVVIWYFVYGYISKFEMRPPELPIEIVTNPTYTYELTSPIQIDFSAERITDKFKKNYDLVSYEWDKESDGKVDQTGQKVTIYFPHGGRNNGVYDVNLLVKMQPKGGGDTIIKEYKKTVSISKQEIYGEIEVDRESGEVPLTVRFKADKIADPHNAKILNYSWDLDGDSRPDRDGYVYRNTTWTFDTIGQHTVSLTVTSEDFNDDGTHESKTFTKTITVQEPEDNDTDVWIEATPKKGYAPLEVKLSAKKRSTSKKSSPVSKYEWKIGDGMETLFGQSASFTFEKPGAYPVELITTFANGQTENDMIEILAEDESIAPEAIVTTNPKFNNQYKAVVGPAPLTVTFDASASTDADDNIVKYDWDFDGDGLWDAEGSIVEHKFIDTGDYTTTLRITDVDNNESRAEIPVKVGNEIGVVDFGASRLSGPAPLTIDFDASGSRAPNGKKIISYEWNFNPKNSSGQTFIYERAQTSHIFPTIGEHFVMLTIHADDGTKYYDVLKVVATYPSLNADFSTSRLTGNAPLGVTFDSSDSSGNIAAYEWIFNDGSTSLEANPVHIFQEPGTYDVILNIYDSQGNFSQTQQTVVAN